MEKLRVTSVIEQYGKCLELVSMDPHFKNITVGLYLKDHTLTIWTFSQKPKVKERIRQIRDQLVKLGGLTTIKKTHNQAKFSCGDLHEKPVKFLLMGAVEKSPDHCPPEEMLIKDTKSELMLKVSGEDINGRWVYTISAEGDDPKINFRLRAIQIGFVRYGAMEIVGEQKVSFNCGQRHDELVKLLLPYSRNISAVEDMLDSSALRGQLTTGTAGFSPL